jgi:hypothetical protein
MPPLDNLPGLSAGLMSGFLSVSERVHLLHVTHGRAGRPTLADLVRSGEIPTSEESKGYCGPGTRFVEEQVGYLPSVYFYAGRACPDYGQAALAFAPASERDRFHSATPFGSGGVVKQDLKSAFRLNLQPDDLDRRVAYCQASTLYANGEPGWRADFARWLATYYSTDPGGYWTQAPETRDPEGLYDLNDDWQAWTWEVRFSRGPSVLEAERWAAAPAFHSELRQALRRVDLASDEAERLAGFVARLQTPAGTATFCEDLERWVSEQCLSKS